MNELKYTLICIFTLYFFNTTNFAQTTKAPNIKPQTNILSNHIRHFEPLDYDYKQVHRRAKRALEKNEIQDSLLESNTEQNDKLKFQNPALKHPIKLEFEAHNTKFNMRLRPDFDSVFKKGAIIEDSEGNSIVEDLKGRLFSLTGHLHDQPKNTLVFGSLKNGIFEGRIHTSDSKVYYVEKAVKYLDDLKNYNDNYSNITRPRDLDFHSVIYSSEDVIHPMKNEYHLMNGLGEPKTDCAQDNEQVRNYMNKIQQSSLRGSEKEFLQQPQLPLQPEERFHMRMSQLYNFPYDESQKFTYRSSIAPYIEKALNSEEKFSYNSSRYKRDTSDFPELSNFNPKPRISHRPPNEYSQGQKRACTLYIQTDTHLWNHTRKHHDNDLDTREEIASLVAQHIKAVNHIYENSDFGGVRGIKFIVQRLRINDTSACEGSKRASNQFCSSNIDVSNFLNLNSQFNHNDFCLAYIFTYRDFSGGTLGLAWVASTNGASGGICEKYKIYTENVGGRQVQTKRSLNTGIITFVNYNSRVPPKVSELTLAHEIGHNFGSPHDFPLECRPGGPQGNYIMYSSATNGERPNNNKFSFCSIKNITTVLLTIFSVDSKDNCFEVDNGAFCGNKIVEEGEECDCGYNAQECTEKCCVPREKSNDDHDNLRSCFRVPGKECSPSVGPCCSDECTFVGQEKICRQETECSHLQTCNSYQAACPEPQPKPNMTECNNGTQVCMSGKCGGSICTKYNFEECFIQDTCEVACQIINQPTTCRRTSEIAKMKHLSGLTLRPGSPCNNFLGFCDTFQKCKPVDAEGPLARLKNALFNQKTLLTIKQWTITHWWACGLAAIAFIILMYIFIQCCAVHTPSSNPKRRPPLNFYDTLRRPTNALRSRPHQSRAGHHRQHRGPRHGRGASASRRSRPPGGAVSRGLDIPRPAKRSVPTITNALHPS